MLLALVSVAYSRKAAEWNMDSRCGFLLLAPLNTGLLAQRHQIKVDLPAVPTASEKIKGSIVLHMS